MKTGRIIHQQIMQLRWHFLACLALLMTLPIEEAFINLKDGAGFYASGLSLGIPVMAGTFLAGLIGCANVQGDLDDRRYIFWRSKPVGVKSFMALKYLVGLFVAFIVTACPIAFSFLTCCVIQGEKIERGFTALTINFQLISLLTYSLCFFCNVLVRKTARAWLIGMAMTCFLLLVPFVLPFRFKDISGDFLLIASTVYISITVGASLVAFIISLFAVSRDWHLRTNLKGLLWTGATLIFLLMLLFSRQVANIKVLDEKEIDNTYPRCMKRINGKLLLETQPIRGLGSSPQKQTFENFYINVDNNQIQFETIDDSTLRYQRAFFAPEPADEHAAGDPIFKQNEGNLYVTSMYVSSQRVKPGRSQMIHENVYIRSYNISNPKLELVSKIDLSEFVENSRSWPDVVMRQIGNKIVAIVNRGCAVIEFTQNGQLKLLEKQAGKIRVDSVNQSRLFSIPIVPLETIEPEGRIKLSLELATVPMSYYITNLSQRVDEYDGRYYFVTVSRFGIALYEATDWDDKSIKYELKDVRSFTILENITNDTWRYEYFVKDGKLYTCAEKSLMIFDIRSDRIRKLGHYARPKRIENIEVLNNGDILLWAQTEKGLRIPSDASSREVDYVFRNGCFVVKGCLTLLKNPE